MEKKLKIQCVHDWWLALLLGTPLIFFFLSYLFIHPSGLRPTGFVQYDNVSYIAYAKQYLDSHSFHLQYSNPFNDHEYPSIYIQPQTLFFALLLKLGCPPGYILIPFTIICSLICFKLIISIYDKLLPGKRFRLLNLWLFAWGGGLLTLAGAAAFSYLHPGSNFFQAIFDLDPEHGWWGLNLGRSLLFSCEAYYHALFLGCIYSLLKKRWITASVCMVTLLFSHPFTGLELLAIVCFWVLIETILGKRMFPYWFGLISIICLLIWVCIYFIYLPQFPDHRSVAEQYSLNWRLKYYRMIPAYALVGFFAIWAIRKRTIRGFFRDYSNRLFFCWFLVAFLLANHEVFIEARQPIHFTRGYIWTSLFLLGLKALQEFNMYIRLKFGRIAIVVFTTIFLLDNFTWIAFNSSARTNRPNATYVSSEQKRVFEILNKASTNRTLIISDNDNISYLSTVYTEAYPWLSHPYTTPFVEKKRRAYSDFMETGKIDSSWWGRNLLFVFSKNNFAHIQVALQNIAVTRQMVAGEYLIEQCDSLRIKQ